VRLVARVALSATAGAVIAWVTTAFVLHAQFAAGGYTREALVEPPPWVFAIIGGAGALVGITAALGAGRAPLPNWVRPAILGSLGGAAVVVVSTLVVACSLGGSSSKGQAPYLNAGLVYGVPVGLVVGAVAGLIVAKRHCGEQGAAADRPRD
jgi:hypothetical protein